MADTFRKLIKNIETNLTKELRIMMDVWKFSHIHHYFLRRGFGKMYS